MYKITFYHEYHLKRRLGKFRVVRSAFLAFLLGAQLIAVASLAFSWNILRNEEQFLNDIISRLAYQADNKVQYKVEYNIVREMLTLREHRIDWSPKLAALSEGVGPALLLDNVRGQIAGKRQTACLEISGGVKEKSSHLEEISNFIAYLREDRRMVGDFDSIELGALKGEKTGTFQVLCEPGREQP